MRFRFSVLGLLCLIGCQAANDSPTASNDAASSNSAAGKTYRIAVIPKGTTHEFFKSIHAGALKAAEELGNVEVIWKGALHENDRDGQISVLQDFITKQVDAICISPLDSQALCEYVAEAADEGIPVVVFDSGLDDESKIVTYIASDNYKGGGLAAMHMGKLLNGQGNVIVFRYAPGSESTTKREDGFLDTLKKDFPQIKILTADEYTGTTPESALNKGNQVLSKYRDRVNGIFTPCEPSAAGILGALSELELLGQVKMITFDPSSTLIRELKENHLHGIVLQDPVAMGYLAVKSAVAYLNGETIEKRIGTGEFLATPENMDTPEIQRLLHPAQLDN